MVRREYLSVALAYSELVLLSLCCIAVAQAAESPAPPLSTQVIATYTVKVAAASSRVERAKTPGFEIVGGKRAITLGPLPRGARERAVTLNVGDYIFLRFSDAAGQPLFTIEPSQGVVEPPPGRYHLPSNTLAMLQAINPGDVTITVHGVEAQHVSRNARNAGSSSGNWSGYAQAGGPFTLIGGQWTVPTVGSDVSGTSVTWVGIDGFAPTDSSLIQAGTGQDYSSGNPFGLGDGPTYYAWWEILPAPETKLSTSTFPVAPGDQILVLINGPGAVANVSSTWEITLYNKTRDWSFSTSQSYSAPLSSAEWIVEAPSSCTTGAATCIEPLADYGSVTFDVYDTVVSGTAGGSPFFTPGQALTMDWRFAHTIFSTPSNPDGDSDGFTVAYGIFPPPPPGPFVTTTSLRDGVLNQPYQQTLHASGPSVIDWSWTGSLPPGLTLDGPSGTISGTPTSAGTFNVSVSALQANTAGVATQQQPLTLTVLAAAPPPPPPDFRLVATPGNLFWTLQNHCSSTMTISVIPLNGFNQPVSLAASNLPTGGAASFSPVTTQNASALTLSSNKCALNQTSNLVQVIGTSGALTHDVSVEIVDLVSPFCLKPTVCRPK